MRNVNLLFLWCGALLIAAFFLGARHDYIAYQWQWQAILAGANPWVTAAGEPTTNTYGPLQNLFTLFYAFHPLLPKLLFVASWLGAGLLYRRLGTGGALVTVFWFFNPFFLIEFVSWGHHEAILAGAILLAVLLAERERRVAAGILLGAGILLKFIPVFLVPLFWIRRRTSPREWHHGFLLSTLATVGLGFALAFALWGSSVFFPLTTASQRAPTLLSVFNYLNGLFSPLPAPLAPGTISALSKGLIVASVLAITTLYWLKRIPLANAVAAALLAVFTFFPVGHQQFHCSVLFLLPLVPGTLVAGRSRRARRVLFFIYAGFLACFQLAFVGFGQYSDVSQSMSPLLAVPFAVICLALAALLLSEDEAVTHKDSTRR